MGLAWVFFFLTYRNLFLFIHFLKLRKPKLRKYANTFMLLSDWNMLVCMGIDGRTADVKNLDKVTLLKQLFLYIVWVSWANLGPFSSVFIQLPCPLYDPFSWKDTVWHQDDLFAAKSAILKMRQTPMLLKAGMGNGNGKTKWVIKNEKFLFFFFVLDFLLLTRNRYFSSMGSWQIMNVQGQIYAQNRGYCVYYPLNILKLASKNVFEQLAVSCVGCFLLSVLWYDFMNKQIFSFFCNNHA